MIAKAFARIHYHVKTLLGITERYYTNTKETPLYGAGQGTQSAGALW